MATKQRYKTTFEVDQVIQPFFTGGSVSLDTGATLLATSLGDDAVLTNLTTGKQLTKIEGDGEPISTLALTPSASHLIICSRSLSMRIYSLNVSPDLHTVEVILTRTLKPHSTPVVVLAVDRTGTLAGTGAADGNVKVWDVAGGYVTHSFRGPSVLVSALHFFEVAADDISHGKAISKKHKKGRREVEDHEASEDPGSTTVNFRLASGSQDGKVRVWDLHRRTAIANLESHVSDVRGLDYSAKQHALVTAGRDKTIIWWDSRTWKPRKVVPSFELIEAAGFLDDGRLTFSAGENGYVRIWETDTGREVTAEQLARSEEEAIVGAVYSARRDMLLCIQMDHTLALYQTPPAFAKSDVIPQMLPLRLLRRIYGTHDDVIDLAYLLPDSSLLALATNSEYVRIVSAVDPPEVPADVAATPCHFGQDVALLSGHQDIVLTLDVDWSGHWIATGAKDHTARLWRVDPKTDSYTCFAIFTGHAQSVGAVALPKTRPPESSPAYSDPLNHPPPFLVTGSQDQTIKRWEVPRTTQLATKKGSGALFTRRAHDKDINAVDVNSTSHLFASASQDRTVKIWSVQEGEVQGILKGHKRGVWTIKFAPAGTPVIQGEDGSVSGRGLVLTGSGDKTVKLWSLGDYSCLRTLEGHSNSVLKVAWLCLPGQADKKQRQVQVASAAGDGLVKVWDTGTGDVECTLDNHTDRVWALAVQPRTNTLVSGSGDSTVTFWRDTSSATQAAAAEAALRLVEQEQLLENHVHAGSYRDAITLALRLNHPARLLALFTRVAASDPPDPGSLSGLTAVDDVLANLADDQVFLLLLRLRDWNANARSAPVAQRILAALVRSYPAARLSRLSVRGARGQRSLRDVLNALRVYTERHYKRMEELVDESYLVEYTLREMDALAPALEAPGGPGDGDVVMVG